MVSSAEGGKRVKVAVIGGGSVGGWITALLSSADNVDLSLLVRSKYLSALRTSGLKLAGWPAPEILESGEVDRTKNVIAAKNVQYIESCAEEASKIGPQDYVIVTVKAHALPAALPTIKALIGEHTAVVTAQNGIPWWYFYYGKSNTGPLANTCIKSVDPEGELWSEICPERVIGCVVYCAMEMSDDPTVILNYAPNRGGLHFGEPDGTMSDRLQRLLQIFEGSTIDAKSTDNIRQAIWTKLMGNAFFNPMTALSRVTWGQLASHDKACATGAAIMQEVLNIAKALEVDMGGMDMTQRMTNFRSAKISFKSSMLQDMEQGRDPEVAALLSAPLEIAAHLGVEVPRLELLETMLILSRGKTDRALNLLA